MNDETKRSRKVAGAIGAAVGVAAIGAIVVVATNAESSDHDERVSNAVSMRDAIPPQANPVTPIEPPGPKWEREPRNAKDTTKPVPAVPVDAIAQARAAGILGAYAIAGGGAFGALDSGGGIAGFDATDDGRGFGLGRNVGNGGGGTSRGTIGPGTIGPGIGRRTTTDGPVVVLGQPVTSGPGELDKAIVRRYLRRHMARMKYCYEKELLAKPALAGTVKASFTILEGGKTSDATASGVDPNVGTCVARVLDTIEFPKPRNGSSVNVSVTLTVRPK
jgi:hypothetical protein